MHRAVWPLLPLLLLTGCKSSNKNDDKQKTIPVQVYKVRPGSITNALEYDADVKGELEVKVFSQVPERIVSMRIEPGDRVKRGQVLAVIRADSLSDNVQSARAAIDAAIADRDNLKDELARQSKLLRSKIVSQAVVDQLQSRLRSADAQVRRLEAMERQASTARGNAVVRAPIDGVIGQRLLDQGDLALPTVPICTVVQYDDVELILEVPERDLAAIRQGMSARIRVARYPRQDFTGSVERIYPTIDRITRTAQVKVVVKNEERKLMPGMLARVALVVERRDGAVVVPYSSIIIEMGAGGQVVHRVYVLDSKTGKAAERAVKIGIIEGKRVEVREGLTFGDELVTRGQHLLRPGREVRVVERLRADGTSESLAAKTNGKAGAPAKAKR